MSVVPECPFEWRRDVYLDIDLPATAERPGLFLLTPDKVTDTYVGWLNDPLINMYLESRFALDTVESTCAFVRTMLDSPENLFLGISGPGTGAHVGNIKLGPINAFHQTAEIGILIGARDAWGKGIGTSAISLLAGLAAEQLSIRKVTAGCYASNVGSQRAFEKAGFVVEGVRPRQVLVPGGEDDLVLMGKCVTGPGQDVG
jgi:[ribosomal protein S5]-alanine N-acetyltransferase